MIITNGEVSIKLSEDEIELIKIGLNLIMLETSNNMKTNANYLYKMFDVLKK